jgi:flagellar biosynthesis/type III secretory pathway protein FliH
LDAPKAFRSLESMVRGTVTPVVPEESEPAPVVPDEDADVMDFGFEGPLEDVLCEVRLFRARLRELVDEALQTIIVDIAADVLGRELALSPSNIQRIVDSALERYTAEKPLRIRVHPRDAATLVCGIPVEADPSLLSGDAILELKHGSVDATLGVRLQTILGSFT